LQTAETISAKRIVYNENMQFYYSEWVDRNEKKEYTSCQTRSKL